MVKKTSYPLLDNAPPHNGPDFIPYLRANNVVVAENEEWIVIENCKYHRPDRVWYTAFAKKRKATFLSLSDFDHLEWKKKAESEQTVKRFHIHLYERSQ